MNMHFPGGVKQEGIVCVPITYHLAGLALNSGTFQSPSINSELSYSQRF